MGKSLSITAFVLSLLFIVPFAPIVGFILGIVAVVKAKDSSKDLKGLAIAAIVIGAFFGFIQLITIFGIILGFVTAQMKAVTPL